MRTIKLLGVKISVISKEELNDTLNVMVASDKQFLITTPNPEILLKKNKDEELFYILNKSDLSLPDGIGLKFAAWGIGKSIIRHTGADLVPVLLKIAEDKNLPIGIINRNDSLSSNPEIEKMILDNFPKLNSQVVSISTANYKNDLDALWGIFQPRIVFCTFGSPWQEKILYHGLKKWPSVKIAIGVGGAFDFLTEKIIRAPRILRMIGFEWLWRLIKQPSRWKRIYLAVLVFPYTFIITTYIKPFFYRPNVACLVFRKKKSNYELLVLERADEIDHWQIPQGGTDGEKIPTAGIRELKEELGTDKFRVVGFYKNIHKYKFPDSNGKFGVKAKYASGYKGQSQSLLIVEFLGTDDDININFWEFQNFKWVEYSNFTTIIYPSRKEAAQKILTKFNKLIENKII